MSGYIGKDKWKHIIYDHRQCENLMSEYVKIERKNKGPRFHGEV